MTEWSIWLCFPDPRKKEYLSAPFGSGIYELRDVSTGELILFGKSVHVANRMCSLLPKPYGCGTRKNSQKQEYVMQNLHNIEYRTLACETDEEAVREERKLKSTFKYRFST